MRNEIFEIVTEAVEDLNDDLDYESLEEPDESTVLFDGSEDSIDSLSLVSLLTSIEKRLKRKLGKTVILADEEAMAMAESPYRSIGALVEFALQRSSAN